MERITHLSASLLNFTRLKNLDVSSNHLVSLEVCSFPSLDHLTSLANCVPYCPHCFLAKGLDHLQSLERLNLYFNKIADLQVRCPLSIAIYLFHLDPV